MESLFTKETLLKKLTVVVRSYKRPEQVCTHTLALLKRNDLLKNTLLLVADSDEYLEYGSALDKHGLKEVTMLITCKGGGASLNYAFDVIPDGTPLFCIDDDMVEFYEYIKESGKFVKKPMTNLIDYLVWGFNALTLNNAGAFSFDYGNMFYKGLDAPWAKIGMFRVCGGFFGAYNGDVLKVSVNHEDDNVRSARLLERFGKNVIFNHFDVKMAPIGKNPGGMQADGSRVAMENVCKDVLNRIPIVGKYYAETLNESDKYKLVTLKFKHTNELKKLPNYTKPIKIADPFGFAPIQDNEPSLESFMPSMS